MSQSSPHLPTLRGGIIDSSRVHHMLSEAALWQVQARYTHIESATAFEDNYNSQVLFALVDGFSHATFQGTKLLDHLKTWGTTQTAETGDYRQMQNDTAVLTHQLCSQFQTAFHTGGPQAAQGFLNGQETLRNEARNKVLAMVQAAGNHDLAVAHEAENTRKSLIVLLTVCEVALLAIGFCITYPIAVTGMAAGIPMAWGVFVVPAIQVGEKTFAKYVSGTPPNTWQLAAIIGSAGSKRLWGHRIYGHTTQRLTNDLASRQRLVQISQRNLAQERSNFSFNVMRGKTPSGLSSLRNAHAQHISDLNEAAKAGRNLKNLGVLGKTIPIVFLIQAAVQEYLDTRDRWNS